MLLDSMQGLHTLHPRRKTEEERRLLLLFSPKCEKVHCYIVGIK